MWILLPLLACRCNTPEDTGAPPVVAPSTDPIGVLIIGRLAESPIYDAETVVHGVFSPDAEWLEPLDPMGAMANSRLDLYFVHDWFMLPAEGEEEVATAPDWHPSQRTTLDAGDRVLLGDDLVAYAVEVEGLLVYSEDDQESLPLSAFAGGGSLELSLDGGEDIGPQTASGVRVPQPIEVTEGNPLATDVVSPDDAIGTRWTPSSDEDALMVVYAYGNESGLVRVLPDAEGQVVFSPEELVDLGGEGIVLQLSRLIQTPVQLQEGVLLVRAIQETSLTFHQVESLGFHPEVALIGERSVIEVYDVEGRLADSTLDLGEGVFTELLEVEEGGEVARFEVISSDDAFSGPRLLKVSTDEGDLLANQKFIFYQELPPNDECAFSETGPALLEGELYASDMVGLFDSSTGPVDCDGQSYEYVGRDVWERMDLVQGEVLKTSALSIYGDVALLIYDECGGELVHCEDFALDNDIEFLEWTVPKTGTYYLLVDNYYELDEDEVYVTWDASLPADLLPYDHIQQGQQGQLLEIETTSFALDGTEVWDLGEDVVITSAVVVADHHAQLLLDISPQAQPGERLMTAEQGGVLYDGYVQLAGSLPLSDDCEDAFAFGPLTNAAWTGTLEGSTLSDFDTSSRTDADLFRDVVYEVELPSEGSALHVNITSQQDVAAYLLRACEPGATPVRFADGTGVADTEFVDFVAGAGEAGLYYLVISAVTEDLALPFEMYVKVFE